MKNTKPIIVIILLILSIILIGFILMVNRSNNVESPTDSVETLPTDLQTQKVVEEPTNAEPQFEEKTIFIGPEQVECVGVAPQMCYQIKENPEDAWLFFYDQIEGFSWEEGSIYELRVAIHQVDNPPADGSSLRYELIEIINKEAAMLKTPQNEIKLEGPNWLLIEFADETLNTILSDYQVTMNLDPERGTAAGSAGCNNYFASYQIDGQNLTLGPAGSTMMMCPEPQMNIEITFLTALAEVAGYQIEGDKLMITNAAGDMILKFKIDPFTTSATFTRQELGNATYLCTREDSCTLTLNNGEYFETVEEIASQLFVKLSNHAAFGDLDGDGIEDAVVILASKTGNTGEFYELAVVKKDQDELVNTAITLLGDNLLIKDIHIEGDVIIVELLVSSADHITCCPDAPIEKRYHLESGELILEK